jgi:hypothetical protein
MCHGRRRLLAGAWLIVLAYSAKEQGIAGERLVSGSMPSCSCGPHLECPNNVSLMSCSFRLAAACRAAMRSYRARLAARMESTEGLGSASAAGRGPWVTLEGRKGCRGPNDSCGRRYICRVHQDSRRRLAAVYDRGLLAVQSVELQTWQSTRRGGSGQRGATGFGRTPCGVPAALRPVRQQDMGEQGSPTQQRNGGGCGCELCGRHAACMALLHHRFAPPVRQAPDERTQPCAKSASSRRRASAQCAT